ncbi:MAG: threonylcarbamoyl-AMP synthase [Lentimicrobiaceae bacterium]|nr:threonylcarbamoyl-AMP synthase [Lentimicrobiaceae bacterium]MCB9023864.1 threonylcarbamoyl-AMP synthase [Lentimicrobiaceae bacterium]MCO5266227.1 L-threonylcarbamoyladenylate synthase [Lentimicrobium sp.]
MNEEFENEVSRTLKTLKDGGIILYPTDTVWGLGCDALNQRAVDKIYKLKQRESSKSLIILVDSFDMLKTYVDKVPEIALDLINSIDKPVTVIYDNAHNLPKNLLAADKTIAIRIVKNDFCQRLIAELKRPIISTSANISGEPTPLVFSKISENVKNQVDYCVQMFHEQFIQAKASTILRLFENGEYQVIRD